MNLDEAQRAKISQWITEGLKLSDIQNRLASELNLRLTYMDVRLLVDDLKLTPKDIERPKTATLGAAAASPQSAAPSPGNKKTSTPAAPKTPEGVSVQVDQLAKPGAVVSDKVTFSDGITADWYFDQTGRLG